MKYRPKHVVEYVFFRAVATTVNLLPYRAALALGWVLALLGHYILRFRRTEARRRIREVLGPEVSPRDIRRIAWISFRNLCFNAVEILRIPSMDKRWFEKYTDIGVAYELREAIGQHQAAVLAVPHMGNWDIAGICCHMIDIPIFFIAGRQKNPLVDDYLNKMRGATGIQVVFNDQRLLKSIIRNLKDGRVMAMLPDVRAKTDALPVQFLGKQANIRAGMALFARQAEAPIFPIIPRRAGWTRHQWQLLDPVLPCQEVDKQQDWQRMTQSVMTQFDQAIRESPEQYFWYNKRWVLDPI